MDEELELNDVEEQAEPVLDINSTITSALAPIGLPVAERLYEGDEESFLTFVIADDAGADHGDDLPGTDTVYIQVHLVCPWESDYSTLRRRIRRALIDNGFTWPDVTDLSDESNRLRHIVFECAIDNDFDLDLTEDEQDV